MLLAKMSGHSLTGFPYCFYAVGWDSRLSMRERTVSTEHILSCYMLRLSRYIPLFLFITATAAALFAYGGLVGRYKLFPYSIVSSGVKTFLTLRDGMASQNIGQFKKFVPVPPENVAANRIQFLNDGSLGGSILWTGGSFEFLDYCPDHGCIAVQYNANGELAHAYPYRSAELEQARAVGASEEFPFEFSPAFSFTRDVYPKRIHPYPNGDLLAIFGQKLSFPFMGGVARIDRTGIPSWFRLDYSHHYGQINDGNAMLPGMLLSDEPVSLDFAGHVVNLECPDKQYHPTINFIDEHGRLFKSLHIMESLLDSQFAPILQYSTDPSNGRQRMCNLLHLNYVQRLGDNAGGGGHSSGRYRSVSAKSERFCHTRQRVRQRQPPSPRQLLPPARGPTLRGIQVSDAR